MRLLAGGSIRNPQSLEGRRAVGEGRQRHEVRWKNEAWERFCFGIKLGGCKGCLSLLYFSSWPGSMISELRLSICLCVVNCSGINPCRHISGAFKMASTHADTFYGP